MLIAASWPSNSEAAVTKRKGDWRLDEPGRLPAAVLIERISPVEERQKIPQSWQKFFINQYVFVLKKF